MDDARSRNRLLGEYSTRVGFGSLEHRPMERVGSHECLVSVSYDSTASNRGSLTGNLVIRQRIALIDILKSLQCKHVKIKQRTSVCEVVDLQTRRSSAGWINARSYTGDLKGKHGLDGG